MRSVLALFLALATLVVAYSSDYKVGKLNKLLAEKPLEPIHLDAKSFTLVTEAPRNYSVLVILTAEGEQFQCAPCKLFAEEIKLVTESLHKKGPKGQVYVGSLDFADGKEIFHKFKLTSVPFVYHFPPTEGPNKRVIKGEYEVYDLNRAGTKAEDFAFWVEKHAGIKLVIRRPIDFKVYGSYFVMAASAISTVLALRSHIVAFLSEKRLWQMMSLSFIVIFCSGYMWNQIRGPPFMGSENGQPAIFAGGFQNQYVVESQIVGIIYGLVSVWFVLLYTQVPKIQNVAAQRTAAFVLAGLFVLTYSLLLRVFKFKNGGYPFTLFL
ncbi:UNVERIFIED_CONTAM: oligosaccharyl transferase subunit ost3/OST6 [Siphonaria sp. JEL0065]|nr:oligosaccharyl transferase subunit ost3/OST6 [Siphonaria sp. JEL0065]